MVSIDHNHIVDHNKLIQKTGRYLFNAIKYSFDRARAGREPEKFSNDPFNIERKYSGIERSMLQNFLVESFMVSGVLSYDLQEKLKELAVKIMNDPAFQTSISGKTVDPNKEFIRLAQGMIAKYNYTGETPPEGPLQTNLRTAISSAWNASNWNKINESGVYPALQYKTMADNRVREEHAKLHDRVWLIDDPVWDSIMPPNSYNCRCRVKPITHDELGQHYVEPTTDQMRADIKVEAGISKEFDRNSGKVRSIWQKWINSKLEKVNWEKVTQRLSDYADRKDIDVMKYLTPKEKLTTGEFSEEKFRENFADTITTPLGSIKIGEKQFKKMVDMNRSYLGNSLKKLLSDPDLILVDLKDGNGATIFIKSFRGEKRVIYVTAIYKEINGEKIITSIAEKSVSRIENIAKTTKLPVYIRRELPPGTRRKNSGEQFGIRSDSLNFEKLPTTQTKFNEIWGRRYWSADLGRYRSVLSYITYRVDGFELTKSIDGAARLRSKRQTSEVIPYTDLQQAREGVLIWTG